MHTREQELPFEVRIARTGAELLAACEVRAEAYGHHLPDLRPAMSRPDALDADPRTVVLIAVDKETREVIGTARIQPSFAGPLQCESCLELPEDVLSSSRCEVTRLAIWPGVDQLVRLAIFKAIYLYCLARQDRFVVLSARSDALARIYTRIRFEFAFEDRRLVPLPHVGGLPHHILYSNMSTAHSEWLAAGHPLNDFMIFTVHKDIDLFGFSPHEDVVLRSEETLMAA